MVSLHVKDTPVFVSDVTEADIPATLAWLDEHGGTQLASRLRAALADGRLRLRTGGSFYTSALPFWEMPDDLVAEV